MNPGALNHHIEIQSYNSTVDEDGFPVEGWVHFKTLWANKQGLTGRTFYAAQAAQSENDVTYKIRYVKGIETGMKVIDGTDIHYLKVDPIDKDGKRKELYLVCNNTKPSTGGESNGG